MAVHNSGSPQVQQTYVKPPSVEAPLQDHITHICGQILPKHLESAKNFDKIQAKVTKELSKPIQRAVELIKKIAQEQQIAKTEFEGILPQDDESTPLNKKELQLAQKYHLNTNNIGEVRTKLHSEVALKTYQRESDKDIPLNPERIRQQELSKDLSKKLDKLYLSKINDLYQQINKQPLGKNTPQDAVKEIEKKCNELQGLIRLLSKKEKENFLKKNTNLEANIERQLAYIKKLATQ